MFFVKNAFFRLISRYKGLQILEKYNKLSMKFLFLVVITILCWTPSFSQCPTNDATKIEVRSGSQSSEVIVKFDKAYENINELHIIKFGEGAIKTAIVRKKSNKEYIIESLQSGEYMVQIIGKDCSTYVGTDKNYKGFIIK